MGDSRDYEDALQALGGLINQRKRADGSNWGDAFSLMNVYIKVLDLDEATESLSVIHVAGTKGKGSTCAFAESILRCSGYTTGLFTSPHLVDVRERFRINGEMVTVPVFLENFWWCYNKCKEACAEDETLPMPAYFRFLTLLALRIFTQLKVDVALLEVGIGGRYDATNVVKRPAVCGVSTLGFDHMELLGDTLGLIAGEKAGIFKAGVPAVTAPQEEEALQVLKQRAEDLQIPLTVLSDGEGVPDEVKLGLAGRHQRVNASLAVALVCKWEERTGRMDQAHQVTEAISRGTLPAAYMRGLEQASWPGRCQIVHDVIPTQAEGEVRGQDEERSTQGEEEGSSSSSSSSSRLSFYLDGAHTQESMQVCAEWFCDALESEEQASVIGGSERSCSPADEAQAEQVSTSTVLLFNCMPERDPKVLLHHLLGTLWQRGVDIEYAMFAPSLSSYSSLLPPAAQTPLVLPHLGMPKTISHLGTPESASQSESAATVSTLGHKGAAAPYLDLSWQMKMQETWEHLKETRPGGPSTQLHNQDEDKEPHEKSWMPLPSTAGVVACARSSAVVVSIPSALGILRGLRTRPRHNVKVLVTGSLHLVGDVLRCLRP